MHISELYKSLKENSNLGDCLLIDDSDHWKTEIKIDKRKKRRTLFTQC